MFLARRQLLQIPLTLSRASITRAARPFAFTMDYSTVPTPAACYADFCLIPVGPPLD